MAWSRWSSTSQIYTFPHVDGGAECCSCPLMPPQANGNGYNEPFRAFTLDDFLAHIAEHVEAQHLVPRGLVQHIREEWDEYAEAKP